MNRVASFIIALHFRYPFVRQLLWACCIVITAGVVFLAGFKGSRVDTLPVGWEKSFTVSQPAIAAKNIHLASRGNFIAAVYEGVEKRAHKIYAVLSFNGGKSFLQPVVIADVAPDIDHLPRVAVSGTGHVAVVWQNLEQDDSNTRVFYSLSMDMGASWSPPVRVFMPSDFEMLPQILYDDRNVMHLFYHGHSKNVFNLYHAVSADEKTFDAPRALAGMEELRGAFFPAVSVSRSDIYVVWQGKGEMRGVLSDDLYYMHSGNYGKSWGTPEKITRSAANDAAPSLFMYRDVLYCAYQNNDERSWAIKLLRGFNRGDTWDEKPMTVSQTNANCYSPGVTSGKNEELVVLWYDTRDVAPSIVARKYLIPERRFSSESVLSPVRAASRKPVAVTVNNTIIVMWEEAGRVFAKYSDINVEPPVVYSATNPENAWSRRADAMMQWNSPDDDSGIAGYAVIVNKIPDFIPTVQNLESNVKLYRVADLDDGVSYFHIRAVDGAGNYSRTVHYKLQVSRSPLPAPVVVSPTHPEGKEALLRTPVFRWSIDGRDRLKGFLYSMSKNTAERPSKFTNDFETTFHNLDDGRYFFSIAAVDRTNTVSRVATYEIIINKAESIDASVYERIAKGLAPIVREVEKIAAPTVPYCIINLPFDSAHPYDKDAFNAIITARNIPADSMAGYSVSLDTKKTEPRKSVNVRNNIISLTGLKNGAYYLSVRGRYARIEGGRKVYYWTAPSVKSFTVNTFEAPSGVVAYADSVIEKLYGRWLAVTISLTGALLSIVTLGFGSRISFFAKLVRFRLRNRAAALF